MIILQVWIHLLCLVVLNITGGRGDFNVFVHVHSYSNAMSHCSTCRESVNDALGCCDQIRNKGQCVGNERCDTSFSFCLRSVAFDRTVSTCFTDPLHSNVNQNDGPLDFSATTFLGLSNPIAVGGFSTSWQGVQVYVRAFDRDTAISGHPLIDSFAIDVSRNRAMLGVETQPVMYTGFHGVAQIQLSFLVLCADNFGGPFCTEKLNVCVVNDKICSDNGECQDNTTCVCNPGFVGEFCEIEINECSTGNITCNGHGHCVDGVNSYNCVCDTGHTGDNCEIFVDLCAEDRCGGNGECQQVVVNMTTSFLCVCNDGFCGEFCMNQVTTTSEPDGVDLYIPIAGGLGGAVLVLILLVVLLVVVMAIWRRKKLKKPLTGASEGKMPNTESTANDICLQSNPTYSLGRQTHLSPGPPPLPAPRNGSDGNTRNVLVVSPWTNIPEPAARDSEIDADGYVDIHQYETVSDVKYYYYNPQ